MSRIQVLRIVECNVQIPMAALLHQELLIQVKQLPVFGKQLLIGFK